MNTQGLQDRFEVDFYGKIDDGYQKSFLQKISELDNVHYSGFLNLLEKTGYDTLSRYDMMLFPTYWPGEGFAGVFIDAQISGLPMIATDWRHNKYFLKENQTAILIPVHNVEALIEKMKACIHGELNLYAMSRECQRTAKNFDTKSVITAKLLKDINVLRS